MYSVEQLAADLDPDAIIELDQLDRQRRIRLRAHGGGG